MHGIHLLMGFATGLCPNCFRELCCRCRGWWKARRISSMGYGWTRRLRSSPTSFIPRFPRYPHLLRRRLSRFPWQRPREGIYIRPRLALLHLKIRNSWHVHYSGFLKSYISAAVSPSFSLVARRICVMTRRPLRSSTRLARSPSLPSR